MIDMLKEVRFRIFGIQTKLNFADMIREREREQIIRYIERKFQMPVAVKAALVEALRECRHKQR